MAIELIAAHIWEKRKGVLQVESTDADALENFKSTLRKLSPQIVIDRESLVCTDPHKLVAKLIVDDDSFEWVRERLTSALSDDALSIQLLET